MRCVLAKIFPLAVDRELLADNPCRRVKSLRAANQRVLYLTSPEKESLFNSRKGQDWVKDITVMAINNGMRREILDLKWFDVDLNRRIVHARQSKSGRPRTIPLNATPQTLRARLPKTSGYVFPRSAEGSETREGCRQAIRAGSEEGEDRGLSFSLSAARRRDAYG